MRRLFWLIFILGTVCCGKDKSATSAEPSKPAEAKTQVDRETSGATIDTSSSVVEIEKPAPISLTRYDGEIPEVIACQEPPAKMACIPGGAFFRGSDAGPEDAGPGATVWVQTFYIDINEVTFEEYGKCARKGRCRDVKPKYMDFDAPRQPMTGVNWYDSVKYCKIQGKVLPTEAQWEMAARGTDRRKFPWGNQQATCERAVIMNAQGERSCGTKKRGKQAYKGKPLEIASRPPAQFGLYDMAGNSWEWVWDWYSQSYEACGENCLGVEPKGPCQGKEPCRGHRRKVVRGGSWYWEADLATTYYRRAHVADNNPFHHFGFRCSATVEQAEQLRHRDK